MDKSVADFNEKLMYISTDVGDKKTDISLIDNLWDVSHFGLPNWEKEFLKNREGFIELDCTVFYSGPRKYVKQIKKSCKNSKIPIDNNKI